jgi:hypothetical protein
MLAMSGVMCSTIAARRSMGFIVGPLCSPAFLLMGHLQSAPLDCWISRLTFCTTASSRRRHHGLVASEVLLGHVFHRSRASSFVHSPRATLCLVDHSLQTWWQRAGSTQVAFSRSGLSTLLLLLREGLEVVTIRFLGPHQLVTKRVGSAVASFEGRGARADGQACFLVHGLTCTVALLRGARPQSAATELGQCGGRHGLDLRFPRKPRWAPRRFAYA